MRILLCAAAILASDLAVQAQSDNPFSTSAPVLSERAAPRTAPSTGRRPNSGQVAVQGSRVGPFEIRLTSYTDSFGKRHNTNLRWLIRDNAKVRLLTEDGQPIVAQQVAFSLITLDGTLDLVGTYTVDDGDEMLLNITPEWMAQMKRIATGPATTVHRIAPPSTTGPPLDAEPKVAWPDLDERNVEPLEREARQVSHAVFEANFSRHRNSWYGMYCWSQDSSKREMLLEVKDLVVLDPKAGLPGFGEGLFLAGNHLRDVDRLNGIECIAEIVYSAKAYRTYPDLGRPYYPGSRDRNDWGDWKSATHIFKVQLEKRTGSGWRVLSAGGWPADQMEHTRKPNPGELPR